MTIGKCKLCLLEGMELQDSHFLSKGIYKILRDDNAKNPNPWSLTDEKAVQISFQLKAPLLCRHCEQERISRNGQSWRVAKCLKKDGSCPLAPVLASTPPDVSLSTTPTRVHYAARIPEIDRSALAYFAASIFWRGSIHPWNRDGSVPIKLGPFQESFRKYLMGQGDFPTDCALLVTVREGKEIDRLTYAPVGERREIFHVYKFPMPGLAFSMVVSKNIPANFREKCFVRGPGNPIITTPIIEKWLLQDAVQLREK